jgi:hypothetical protein
MTSEALTSIRELDSRLVDGLHVRLWWDSARDAVWVSVLDTRSGDAFRIEVRSDQRPRDVFHHPFAYAPREHLEVAGSLHATTH